MSKMFCPVCAEDGRKVELVMVGIGQARCPRGHGEYSTRNHQVSELAEVEVTIAEAWVTEATYRVPAASPSEAHALIAQGKGILVRRDLTERLYQCPRRSNGRRVVRKAKGGVGTAHTK